MANYKTHPFPKTRIATNDVCAVGLKKHHVAALIEIDVTDSRQKIRKLRKHNKGITFTAWLIKEISSTITKYESVAAYLKGKRRAIVFDDVNMSVLVEKEIDGQKVPIPLLIEKADKRSIESISEQIDEARKTKLTDKDIVLHSKPRKIEHLYYALPGFARRMFWGYVLRRPSLAYGMMGNVSLTTVGMFGKATGWFIPISINPVCFGIGRVCKKPAVVNNKIEIREMLNLSILLDHDVVDGAQMARFASRLTHNVESGSKLEMAAPQYTLS